MYFIATKLVPGFPSPCPAPRLYIVMKFHGLSLAPGWENLHWPVWILVRESHDETYFTQAFLPSSADPSKNTISVDLFNISKLYI